MQRWMLYIFLGIVFILFILILTGHFKPKQFISNQILNQIPMQTTLPKTSPLISGDLNIYKDIQYKYIDNFAILLDIYQPLTTGQHPALITIHGGGHAEGDKSEWTDAAKEFAQYGFVVFNINYRLAPPGGRWPFPAGDDDVHDALLWVRQNGAKYGVNTTKVGAIGGSAGGDLVMMLTTTGTRGQDKADVGASLSGTSTYNLLPDDQAKISPATEKQRETASLPHISSYLNCSVDQLLSNQCPQSTIQAASPAYQVDSSDSPLFIVNGDRELTPANQATFMAEKLKEAGVSYQLKILNSDKHALKNLPLVLNDVLAFLHKYLD